MGKNSKDIMQTQVDQITGRIASSGLAERGSILIFIKKLGIFGEHQIHDSGLFGRITEKLDRDVFFISTLCGSYRTIIDYLAETSVDAIYPGDYETRILLTDIPVIANFTEPEVVSALRKRRGAIIRGGYIVTCSRNLEMAYVTFSSICFACFVKFFSDYLRCRRKRMVDLRFEEAFRLSCRELDVLPDFSSGLMKGPFKSGDEICAAIAEAGKLVVKSRLVDSTFGNVSYFTGRTLYISRTGSFLDRLEGCIDAADLESPETVPETVSSEFPVHRDIVTTTGFHAVLHGHPKFSVILSMDCTVEGCEAEGSCQTMCPGKRSVTGIPVVPGESGTGPYGLCHKLPPAMKHGNAVIVYGHGVFTAGVEDFNDAFQSLLSVEKKCRQEYFRRLEE